MKISEKLIKNLLSGMAFTFKLGNPTLPTGPGIAEVPAWLEEHLSMIGSENDEAALGNVDTTMIRGEPFNCALQTVSAQGVSF